MLRRVLTCCLVFHAFILCRADAQTPKDTGLLDRIRSSLDSVPAIDTHDHLWPRDRFITLSVKTERGLGMNLWAVLNYSYYPWINPLTPWKDGESFDEWWSQARGDFTNAHATTFYRYLLPAFQDLYGTDFDRITDEQARKLDARIFDNYRDPKWLPEIITERANIELMFIDPYWDRLGLATYYPFQVLVLNITSLIDGFHPSEFKAGATTPNDPYHFAREHKLDLNSLDDYLVVLDRLMADAKGRGAACLKQVCAYTRTIEFRRVPRERAAAAFGLPRSELTPEQIRDFEDFIMWRITELAAKYDLPIQIHTGQARIQGSNPMLLVDLIEANPRTKFILFHGGFPWVGEAGIIAMRYPHVWLDSVWLPTLSYSAAKRAFHEWLEIMPSSRILWGADSNTAEGVYGATELTRRCLAEVLAEKVAAGNLCEEDALRIGRQILRDNALQLFPQLKERLWKDKPPLRPDAPATHSTSTAPGGSSAGSSPDR